ncbi:ABC transporter ATP-binding protein [Pedobacter nototheniae]|uniref:ABC transporter ATP-binding protein n=1 Tax=Pedobacter nototheniae TaxID=2488994 RepID=UPI00292E23EC|nr:ABC transporter ATP-binding protein [Pedobacter nototheniae]
MNTLQINQLNLSYKKGVKAINNISLEISNGMFGLLGPNGAGKSSLMKTIVGLQKPDDGQILFNGIDVVKQPDAIKKYLGFLPQDFGVYPKVSAYNLLQHLALLKGVNNGVERKQQILDLLEKVNLRAFKDKEVNTFSGGMKQRFGVAQALLGNPKIIIVDEPTAGLDPEERNRFNTLLSEISEDVIVILSTHLVEDVRNLCSQMAIMQKGSLLALGKPAEMTAALKGKIWTRQVTKHELGQYQTNHQIISQQLIEKVMHITVYADTQPGGFVGTVPTLEHCYFHQLNR